MTDLYITTWLPVFEGEEDDAAAAAAAAAAEAGDGGVTTVVTDPPKDPPADNTFNAEQQKALNKILAAEKKKHQALTQKAIDEATAMRAKASLTAKENQEYDVRIDQMRNELLTKEEQAKRAADKVKKVHQEEKADLSTDRDYWKKQFTDSTIERSLTDAAATNNAFSPRQIVAILGPNTQLAEVLDDDGKSTGSLEPKVRYSAKDSEGKPVTLDLSPKDAVKRMKDEEEYLNLFRGEGTGGAGLRTQPGGRKPNASETAKDPAAYRKARKDGTISFQ